MKTSMMAGMAAVLFLGAAALATAAANDHALGVRGDENRVTRVVVITPQTRWVNVESGETIRFVDAAGNAVVWRFDTPSWATGALADFAPQFARARDIKVYVAESVLYRSDI